MIQNEEAASSSQLSNPSYAESELLDSMPEEFNLKSCLRLVTEFPSKTRPSRLLSTTGWNKSFHPLSGPPLPTKLWIVIAKILGIRLAENEKPWLATFLYVMTWASAICFITARSCYIAYDLATDNSSTTELKFIFTILLKISWGILAIYANNLAYRMFTRQAFVKNIRLHCKTLLKCNVACLIIVCGFLFTVLGDYSAYEEFQPATCQSVNLTVTVCQIMYISRVVFSIFAFIWNTLIALVLVSVCRTHTFNIRQFKKDLEQDALSHNDYNARTCSVSTGLTNVPYFSNGIDISLEDDIDDQSSDGNDDDNRSMTDRRKPIFEIESVTPSAVHTPDDPTKNIMDLIAKQRNRNKSLADFDNAYLHTSEILRRYWKLQRCLHLSSSAFKRWMVSFMCLCLVWVGTTLVNWLTEPPSILDVILFLIPLIWLPALSSAIAEVNNEGQRVLRFVYPLEERIRMLIYLNETPLQISIYGYGISYSTMVTSLFGLVAALLSGVLMQEIKKL